MRWSGCRVGTEEEEVQPGVVTRRYQPLQNVEAFAFFDPIVGEREGVFRDCQRAIGEGERIWVMARMHGATRNRLATNASSICSFPIPICARGLVIAKFTSVRVVCQNTLMMAMEDGQKAYRVRHSKKMQFKLEELSQFLAITQQVFLDGELSFRRLAEIQMVGDRLDSYFDAVYPRTRGAERRTGE